MKRPNYKHYEDANLYDIDLGSWAEWADNEIKHLQSELEKVLKENHNLRNENAFLTQRLTKK